MNEKESLSFSVRGHVLTLDRELGRLGSIPKSKCYLVGDRVKALRLQSTHSSVDSQHFVKVVVGGYLHFADNISKYTDLAYSFQEALPLGLNSQLDKQ